MTESRLKLPDEYTELSYEDGELSGSGNRRWSSEDTKTVLKQVGILGGICTVGAIWYFREPIGRGITNAWNYITGCCSHGDNVIPDNTIPNDLNNDIQNNNNDKSDGQNNNNKSDGQNNNDNDDGNSEEYIELENGISVKKAYYDKYMSWFERDPRDANYWLGFENQGKSVEEIRQIFPQYKNTTEEVPVSENGSILYKADNDKTGYVYDSKNTSVDSDVDKNDPALAFLTEHNQQFPPLHPRLEYDYYKKEVQVLYDVATEEVERRYELNKQINQTLDPNALNNLKDVYHSTSTHWPWNRLENPPEEQPPYLGPRPQLDVCLERASTATYPGESGAWLNYQEEKLGYPREKILADYPDYQEWLAERGKK